MSDLWPISLLAVMGCVWLTTSLQGRKLYLAFLSKYPNEAQALIPFAFSNTSHPEKFFFFFRKTSLPMLKADAYLWKLRQRLKLLAIISAVLPIACMGLLAICAWMGL